MNISKLIKQEQVSVEKQLFQPVKAAKRIDARRAIHQALSCLAGNNTMPQLQTIGLAGELDYDTKDVSTN